MPLYEVLHSQVIARFEKNRGMIHEPTIENWMYSHYVFVYLRLYLVTHVVIDRISHELWESTLKAFLVELIIIEYLYYHIQISLIFISKESYSISLVWNGC